MNIEIIKIDGNITQIKPNAELLTLILLNQDKILDGYKIAMVSDDGGDIIGFNLKSEFIPMLETEMKNLKALLFDSKFDNYIKE